MEQSFAEKLAIAKKMRAKSIFKPVAEEDFNKYDVEEKEFMIMTSIGKSRIFLIKPTKLAKNQPLIVNFHGGGFINKRFDRDRLYCFKLAQTLQCLVVDVDYKLAPEYVFPNAVNECYDIVKWINENASELQCNPDKIYLIGHSAGGNLALTSLLMGLQNNEHLANKLVMEYPPLDLKTSPYDKPSFERDLAPERAVNYNSFYCQSDQTGDYLVSPLYAPEDLLSRLPKTLVINGSEDRLAKEGQDFVNKIQEVGVEARGIVFEDSVHGFTVNQMDQWQEAFSEVLNFLK